LSKKRYPKSSIVDASIERGPAYISWEDEENRELAFSSYTKAIQEVSDISVQRAEASQRRDFSGLTSYADGKPALNSSDFDWFRPGQAAPTRPKDIIAFGRYAYRRIGLVHNSIDLMGDFASQGVRVVHPNKRIERFMQDWFKEVNGIQVSERLSNLLFREANVPIRWYTAKVNKSKRNEMQKAIGSDMQFNIDDPIFQKNEIPWRYAFIDPLLVEPVGGPLYNLSNKKVLELKVPLSLKNQISKLAQSNDPEARKVLDTISPDIIRAANGNGKVILPPDKTDIFYYKKDDFQTWADPITYAAFEPLNLYQRLQLADKAALDGAMNKIRVWKIGSLEHKLAPTPEASSTLADMLGANVGGGTVDVIWGPDIELLETGSDIQKYLGEEKYKPTLMAIYATLGIPPTLTGTFGAGGTTNNFISLKTLVERLDYVRGIVIKFWEQQLKLVQKAMGFRTPASVEFDIMYLDDPASMYTLLMNMADRNLVSDEFVQRNVKANPDLETRRIKKEWKARESSDMEKISPYHQVDQDYGLKKIALQTGVSSPSEVGLELEEKKEGENSLVDIKQKQAKEKQANRQPQIDNKNTGEPGRPENVPETQKREQREFKPKLKASSLLWAKKAQEAISESINPVILKYYGKSSVRNLTSQEFLELEQAKFEILCNLNVGDDISSNSVAKAAKNPDTSIHDKFNTWMGGDGIELSKLTIQEVRDMRISFYAENYGK
jgi:hypothetical protein